MILSGLATFVLCMLAVLDSGQSGAINGYSLAAIITLGVFVAAVFMDERKER